MNIYLFNRIGKYIKTRQALPNPREPGEFLLPINATFTAPPAPILNGTVDGYWNGTDWTGTPPETDPTAGDPLAGLPPAVAKRRAAIYMLEKVDEIVARRSARPFNYNGNSYYPDVEFIHGMFSLLPELPSGYTETWKTADTEADGIRNVYVTLDKDGITGLAKALFTRKKNLWAAGEANKVAIKNLALDPDTTYKDILNYDISYNS